MMMMPSIFGENLFDNWMDTPFRNFFGDNSFFSNAESSLMKTDVQEKDGFYVLDMDLPGYKKEDVSAQLKDGYLTINATKNENNDEKDNEGNYIRRERYSGQCQRSFYVGDSVKEEDIKAKFEDGILKLAIPKTEQKNIANNKYIAIE